MCVNKLQGCDICDSKDKWSEFTRERAYKLFHTKFNEAFAALDARSPASKVAEQKIAPWRKSTVAYGKILPHKKAEEHPSTIAKAKCPTPPPNKKREADLDADSGSEGKRLKTRLEAVDEYVGTLRDEQLQDLKETLNQIFRAGKSEAASSSGFSREEVLDSFADEIREIAKKHQLDVAIISDLAKRFILEAMRR